MYKFNSNRFCLLLSTTNQLIENRQEEGYDKGLTQPGIAIYHIDELANNIGSHPGDKHFPRDHYIVALIQADGRFDLERMEDEGDTGT